MKNNNVVSKIILILFSLLVWGVLIILISGSLMSKQEIIDRAGGVLLGTNEHIEWALFPSYPTLCTYVELLIDSLGFYVMFWNSFFQCSMILIGQLIVSVMGAWSFARYDFYGKKILFVLYVILMVMPFQVTMLSEYFVLNKLNMIDTDFAVILPGVFATLPVFVMTKFFKAIPEGIIEAAKIDGANQLNLFLKIGMPLGKVGCASMLILSFMENWNAIERPMSFLKEKVKWPLALYLPNIVTDRVGIAFAASVVVAILPVAIFISGHEYLEKGIAASGLKE